MLSLQKRAIRVLPGLVAFCAVLFAGCSAAVTKTSVDSHPLSASPESAKHIVLNVTGSQVATESKDWNGFKGLWNDAMNKEAAAAGARLTIQEGDTPPASEPGTLVIVYINDYRWVSAGARVALGIATGESFVSSKVRFIDLQSGDQLGDRSYYAASSAGQGIFAAMTDAQVTAICKEIVADMRPH